MKKTIKFLLTILSFVIIFCTFNNNLVYADNSNNSSTPPSWKVNEKFNAEEWNPKNDTNSVSIIDTTMADKKVSDIGNKIIGPIQVIGSLVSVIAIIIIGIKYMIGSVEEKAQYKETLGPYLLGAVFVFAITNILSIIYNIATSI